MKFTRRVISNLIKLAQFPVQQIQVCPRHVVTRRTFPQNKNNRTITIAWVFSATSTLISSFHFALFQPIRGRYCL